MTEPPKVTRLLGKRTRIMYRKVEIVKDLIL